MSLESLKNENLYLKIEKDSVQKLLKSNSEINPYKDKTLARRLRVKFNEKFSQALCIKNWYNGNRCIPMNKLKLLVENSKIYNWSNIESNLTGIKSFGLGFTRFIKPNFPIRDDKQLGLIVGHILGDGWIDSRFSQPCYCNSNKDLLDEFASCMNNLFGVQPRIWVQKIKRFDEKSEWSMRIENVNNKPNGSTATLFYPKSVGIILFNIFGKFVNKRKKKIPEISFELSTEFKSGIIRAMYDDEGSVSVDAQHIRLHQDNSKMLGDIRKMLFDFKISSSPVRNYYKKGKKRYYFGIYGYNNFVKFQKLISFTSFNKKEKLNELIRHLER